MRFVPALLLVGACSQSPSVAPVDASTPNDLVAVDAVEAPDVVVEDVAPVDVRPARDVASPFRAGPYGVRPRDTAGPFTLETQDGPWSFEDAWTGDESFVFFVWNRGAFSIGGRDYSSSLFERGILDLLDRAPRNVHWVFLWARDEPGFMELRDNALADIDSLDKADRDHWRARVHFVTPRVDMTDTWITELYRARYRTTNQVPRYEAVQWAVDRDQRIREVGQLGRLAQGGLALDVSFAADEPRYYNFEHDREARLRADGATVVEVLRDEVVTETTFPEVSLPDATAMAGFDTLEVDLSTHCVNHRDGDCGAWDYISDLRLCELPDADAGADAGAPRCDAEIARWITTYWREGRWVTDISPMLPLLREGGRRRFRWYASRQFDPRPANYVVSLSLRFSNRSRPLRPFAVERVAWPGGRLNTTYGERNPAFRFTPPAGTRKVELYTLITGHGAATGQCAEFCNHQHHFAVGAGMERSLRFPEAQTLDGCRDRVDEGVVPNQHGTWYFGRGGWCPGLDVRPFIADLTADARVGEENELRYRASIGSAAPVATRDYGNINLSAYLVYSR
ncbi:MAG: peptide-N-glycosidase F-related protein [Polyangiales bacterium]